MVQRLRRLRRISNRDHWQSLPDLTLRFQDSVGDRSLSWLRPAANGVVIRSRIREEPPSGVKAVPEPFPARSDTLRRWAEVRALCSSTELHLPADAVTGEFAPVQTRRSRQLDPVATRPGTSARLGSDLLTAGRRRRQNLLPASPASIRKNRQNVEPRPRTFPRR